MPRRVQRVPPGQRREGLRLQPVLSRPRAAALEFEVKNRPWPRAVDPTAPRSLPLNLRRTDHEYQKLRLAGRRLSGRDDPPHRDVRDRRFGRHGGRPPAREADDSRRTSPRTAGISRPTDYRETFLHLGTYAVATKPDKPVDEMHNVYARPEDVGVPPGRRVPRRRDAGEGCHRVGSEKLTTGQSHWATDVKLWFVMVKDSKGRFPENDLWGDGWGWALFMARNPRATWRPTTGPTASRATCRPGRTTGCTSADTRCSR